MLVVKRKAGQSVMVGECQITVLYARRPRCVISVGRDHEARSYVMEEGVDVDLPIDRSYVGARFLQQDPENVVRLGIEAPRSIGIEKMRSNDVPPDRRP